MKIKIGRDRGARPDWDVNRVRLFRELAGDDVELMVADVVVRVAGAHVG